MDILSQEITIVLIGSAFFLLVAVGIIVLFLVYQKKQLQMFLQKQQLESEYRQELLNTKLEVQEQTLNRVSQEIHDNIGQILSLVKLNINKALTEPDKISPSNLTSTKELVQKAIQDLRTISKTLNSGYLNKTPLAESLQQDLALVKQSGACDAQLHVEGTEQDLDAQKKLVVYRMTQELLNNALKHSQASLIQVFITFTEKEMRLRVEDNGVGLGTKTKKVSGTGLGNLHVRAQIIGGKFSIADREGGGTQATLLLPL